MVHSPDEKAHAPLPVTVVETVPVISSSMVNDADLDATVETRALRTMVAAFAGEFDVHTPIATAAITIAAVSAT
jgi:hypothetical protein